MGRLDSYSSDSLNGIYAVVLDSDTDRRALVSGVLRYCGALVTVATSPQAAFAIMELLKPDVVIVDLATPDDGAHAFIRGLRALKPDEGGMVPAVAIADEGTESALARSRGFDACITKPVEPWELCRIVGEVVSG